MKTKAYFFCWIISIFLRLSYSQAQSGTLIIHDQNLTNGDFTARDKISVLPNTNGTTSSNEIIHLYIDENILPDVDYSSNPAGPSDYNINTNLNVGAIKGEADVSSTGAATYDIPIFIPPGTAGMQPSFSISYNSQSSNGLLGTGWNLNGLSAISRAPRNRYFDNTVSPVMLNNNDVYSLDGARLLAAGGYYHTETETFSKIEKFGSSGNGTGPDYFTVKTKDGKILEYGNTSDSKVEAGGISNAPITMWLLCKVTDPNGNFMKYFYKQEDGESFVDRVEYTGNATTLQPYCSIKFFYEKRADKNKLYIAGYSVPQTLLLSSIKCSVEEIVQREYDFGYSYFNYLGSHLTSVNSKGKNGEELNTTVIRWNTSSNSNVDPTTNSGGCSLGHVPAASYANVKYTGDFNGDGFTDYFIVAAQTQWNLGTTWSLFINDDGYGFIESNSGTLPTGYERSLLGWGDQNHRASIVDANGDGKDDVILSVVEGQVIPFGNNTTHDVYYAMLSTGSGFNYSTPFSVPYSPAVDLGNDPEPDNTHSALYGDFDGDGATDLFLYYFHHDTWFIYNFWTGVTYTGNVNGGFGDETLMFNSIDFDGDGKDEIMFRFDNPNVPEDNISNYNTILTLDLGSGALYTLSHGEFPNHFDKRVYTGDFNGDGNTDLLSWFDNPTNTGVTGWRMFYSTRSGSVNYPIQYKIFISPLQNFGDPELISNDYEYFVADFNGDGKSDIAMVQHNSSTNVVTVYYSMGNGSFSAATPITINSGDWIAGKSFIGDFNGDGRADIIYSGSASFGPETIYGVYFFSSATGGSPYALYNNYNKVSSITNGLNETIFLEYSTLPEMHTKYIDYSYLNEYYHRGSGATNPIVDLEKPISVVAQMKREDGIGGYLITKFGYEGAKAHFQGKGFLGFTKISSTNITTDWKTVTNYALVNNTICFSYISDVSTFKGISSNSPITTITNTINTISNSQNGKIFYNYFSPIIDNDFLKGIIKTTNLTYDTDGNVLTSIESTDEQPSITKTTINEYDNIATWGTIKNKLVYTEASQVYGQEDPFTKTTHYQYDNNGNLEWEYIDRWKSKGVKTEYLLPNIAGLPTKTIVSAPNSPTSLTPRITDFEYDNKFRFINKTTNAIGHSTFRTYDAIGNVLSEKNINGKTTYFLYDGYGNFKKTLTPEGNLIKTDVCWSNGNGPSNSLYYTRVSAPGRPNETVYYDKRDRELRKEKSGLNNSIIITDKQYNNEGQLSALSKPSLSIPNRWIYYEYDDYGRISSVIDEDRTVNTTYNNLMVTIDCPQNSALHSSKIYNSAGNLVQEIDNGGSVIYDYNSAGKPTLIDAAGVRIIMHYDEYGRQDQLNDPNAGIMQYEYDAFEQLYSQTDVNNITYSFEYNTLGQLKTKTCSDGTIYNYDYTNTSGGLEQVSSITCTNGTSQTFEYDQYGRATQFKEELPGKSMQTNYEYDSYGNLTTHTYPSGFSITNNYDDNGFLASITKNPGNTIIWSVDQENANGQPLQYTYGNGQTANFQYDPQYDLLQSIQTGSLQDMQYSFDPLKGVLLNRSRSYNNNSLYEDFTQPNNYDNQNRLRSYSSTINGVSGTSVITDIDNNGNITYKEDAGDYTYDQLKKHAVTEVLNNHSHSIPPFPQHINYTAFKKIEQITENGKILDFTYGPDQERVKTILTNGSVIKTKYFSSDYEEENISGIGTKNIHYISGTHGLVAVYIINSSGNGSMYYILKDHLGSITGLMDDNGALTEEYSYDAWGRRRNPVDGEFLTTGTSTGYLIDRGFTGHEHLDEFGLINMNGRLYDPILGRMLSPDNFTGSADNSQVFNRYTYAKNNPLLFSDPDGNNPLLAVMLFAAFVNVCFHSNDIQNVWQGLGYAAVGAAAGATGYGIGAAAIGATGVSGGFAAGFIGGGAGGFAGGFVGGVGNAFMTGSNFNQAFEAGWMEGGMGGITGALAGGILNGIDSKVNNRDFWSGKPLQKFNSPFFQRTMNIARASNGNFSEMLEASMKSGLVLEPPSSSVLEGGTRFYDFNHLEISFDNTSFVRWDPNKMSSFDWAIPTYSEGLIINPQEAYNFISNQPARQFVDPHLMMMRYTQHLYSGYTYFVTYWRFDDVINTIYRVPKIWWK